MDGCTSCAGDAALDLSIFTDCNTSHVSANQPLIMLPSSTITVHGSDNVPFYISPTGQLILANTIVERVNDGFVFKQTPINGLGTVQDDHPAQALYEQTAYCDEENFENVELDNEDSSVDDQKILSEKVRRILTRTTSRGVLQEGCVVVQGHNLTKLVLLAERLKRYRVSRRLSQSKLCKKIEATAVDALKISQSFLCRFEKLDVTLRGALGVQPFLDQWLTSAECEETDDGQTDAICFPDNDFMADLLDLRDRTVSVIVPDSVADNVNSFSLPARRSRKSRSVFDEASLAHLNRHFKSNPKPQGDELTRIAAEIGHPRESVRIWFCNRRYQLKLSTGRG